MTILKSKIKGSSLVSAFDESPELSVNSLSIANEVPAQGYMKFTVVNAQGLLKGH